MSNRNLLGGVAFAALLSAAPAAVYAQQTTGAITGAVVSDTGAPIAGATVTVLNKPTGTRTVLRSDANGVVDARGLRVGGPYVVTASAPHFATQTSEDIYLTVGDLQKLQLVLLPSAQEVTVTGRRLARTRPLLANVGSRTVERAADIEAIVSVKRDIRDIGRRDPLAELDLVNRSTGPSGGLYIAGSSPRRNRITIDGIRSQDDFGLNTGGLSTNRGPVSLDAVEQVSITAVPFDVEDGDFTGGALNIILKSGTNDFHGDVFDFHRERRWAGHVLPNTGFVNNDVTQPALTGFKTVTNKIHEENYGAFLSGPIWKDKLFFAVSYENFESFSLTSYGPSGSGYANSFNNLPCQTTGCVPSSATSIPATAAAINNILSNWNGYAASSQLKTGTFPATTPIKDEKESVKIDYNITDNQRLTAEYRHAYSSVVKNSPTATGIYLDTNGYSQPENEDNYILQLNSKWSPQLSTEIRGAFRGYQRGQLPPEGQGFAQISICTDHQSAGATNSCTSGNPTISFGPDQFRQANALKTTDWSGQFVANYRWNDQNTLKLGYQFKGIHVFDLFVQNAHGTYYFDSVADFQAGNANQLSYSNSFTGNPLDAAERFSYNVHTLFAQDTWDILPGVTLNAGLRDDIYVSNVAPTLNANFVGRYGFSNQTTYDGDNVLMPRLSARWHTDRFDLSGGVGRVSGGLPDVLLGNAYGADTGALTNGFTIKRTASGTDTFTETQANLTITPAQGAGLLDNLKTNSGFITSPGPLASTLVNADSVARRTAFTNSFAPNFEIPADWKANLSYKFSHWGFDFQVDGVVSRSDTNIAFRDIRSRLLTINGVQQYTPDGRLRYDGLNIPLATRQAMGLPTSTNPDLVNLGTNGDIQAYNPSVQTWSDTLAFTLSRLFYGVDTSFSYITQNGQQAGGISEFGTTEGGTGGTGNYYSDQTWDRDPNGIAKGRSTNLQRSAYKLNASYKYEWKPGWKAHFTLFAEDHEGRPFSFLMTDPTVSNGRSPSFGVSREDALAYVPDLSTCSTAGTIKCTTGSTTVYFDSLKSFQTFSALVSQFKLPQGTIVPKGYGTNPWVNRFDFQFAQEIPVPIRGHSLLFTLDIANLGNFLNSRWGVVKEFTNARAGGALVNVQCADAAGNAAGTGSATCATYRYSYANVSASALATPTVDPISSLYTIEVGLKYKF